jgi:hypothetical protein
LCIAGVCRASSNCTDSCTSKGYECGNWTICGIRQECGVCGEEEECRDGECEEKPGKTIKSGEIIFWAIIFGLMIPLIGIVVVIVLRLFGERKKEKNKLIASPINTNVFKYKR